MSSATAPPAAAAGSAPNAAAPRPAILGGTPAVTLDQADANRWPLITAEDEQAVLNVLRSGAISIHPEVELLEADYRKWLGMPYCIAHNNGTGALHGAMHAFEIQAGDEVIVPSATWWASVMPVLHAGAIPVFAETETDCIGLDPVDVEKKITPRTRAIVVVHLFGMPTKMNEIMAIARKHNIKVLEDASHSHGATYDGKLTGTLADAAVFSMQANKLVPSAEGGVFLTRDAAMYEKAMRYGHYERLLGLNSPNKRYAATGFGHKFRMSPLSAAVARVQLKHLSERNKRRNENCIYLSEKLEKVSGGAIFTFLAPPQVQRVYFEFLVRVDESRIGVPLKDFAKALQAEGAQVGAPRYPLLHQQPMFTDPDKPWARIARLTPEILGRPLPTYDPMALPATAKGNASLLKLPSFPRAERRLLDQYVMAFEKVLAHAAQLPRGSA